MAVSPNFDPIFISQPQHWFAELNSQVLPRAGGAISTSNSALLVTAGDNGGVITSVGITPTGVVAANVCCLFTVPEDESTARLRAEVALPAAASATNTAAIAGYPVKFTLYDTEPFEATSYNFLKLSPRESLYCALLQAESTSKFIIHAVGGLYDQI